MGPRILVALTLLLGSLAVPVNSESADPSGSIVIAGNGPEYRVIEQLARAFEKANPRAYVDVPWDVNAKPVEILKTGQAHIAVTGSPDPDLTSTQIAWDGIAVLVNLSNTTKEVTSRQVADLFTGKITQWSDLGGPETRVLILDRARQTNIRETFEDRLGIAGKIPESAKTIGPDDKAVKTVAGTLPPLSAVTFVSLAPALEAVASGVAVRLLPIDKVEPEEPTVKDGRYTLRRPVLLLTRKEANPTVEAFLAFALSPSGQKILDVEYTMVNHGK
jgi:phosphate transport system substrate-binding protein